MKKSIIKLVRQTPFGNKLYYKQIQLRGKLPVVDYTFPTLISLEVASICNLTCIHCPSHNQEQKVKQRKYGIMDFQLFCRAMDEIDQYGVRNIALHKDGEPLLHPDINLFLERVKKNQNHRVYLTTNGHFLTSKIARQIISAKIDRLNISIGASIPEIYKKVRGGDLAKVVEQVEQFLTLKKELNSPIIVSVQIINLVNLDFTDEIKKFKLFWQHKDVDIEVWDELSWGVKDLKKTVKFRYPCFSLWNSFNINSDGIVTACCIDWNQQLVIGNINTNIITEIWRDEALQKLRQIHIDNKESNLPLCGKCNYWYWQPMLPKYYK